MSPRTIIDLEHVGFDEGAHLVVKHALGRLAPGDEAAVTGTHPALTVHLRAWCRANGHGYEPAAEDGSVATIRRGAAVDARARSSEATPRDPVEHAPSHWGLAPRGARVELGGPEPVFALDDRDDVWSADAGRLYAQATANQWDPERAVPWTQPRSPDPVIESAVVQIMTYLVENEVAALVVPARFLGQIHPHFREAQQLLAVQVADEARHIEVFTRRATLGGAPLGLSTVSGRASLQTLLDEPDFATASFLLSVLGEGTFLALLSFIEQYAPDEVTLRIAQLSLQDEARHVAFGLSHLRTYVDAERSRRGRLAAAVERRHDALANTGGLNADVFDALVVIAAGSLAPADIATGWHRVQQLQSDMDAGRRRRLARLGFTTSEAELLSSLHTRNFM